MSERLTGQLCPRCDGHLVVLNSRRSDSGETQYQYYGCHSCGFRPDDNKRAKPAVGERQSRTRRLPGSRLRR